jgi:hypothetical protein
VSDVYALVREIRENRLSRNRNFDALAGASGVEARRVHRFLRAVERDLAAASEVEVRQTAAGSFSVAMSFPSVRLTRVLSLTEDELRLLSEDPRLAALLQPRG